MPGVQEEDEVEEKWRWSRILDEKEESVIMKKLEERSVTNIIGI